MTEEILKNFEITDEQVLELFHRTKAGEWKGIGMECDYELGGGDSYISFTGRAEGQRMEWERNTARSFIRDTVEIRVSRRVEMAFP